MFFGMQNPWHIATSDFGDVQVKRLYYGDTRTGSASNKNRLKVLSFYSWNRTERLISQPILSIPQSPLDDLGTTFGEHPLSDCSRAICVLLQGPNQLLVPSWWGKAQIPSKISKESLPWSHRIDQKRRQKISKSYIRNIFQVSSWNSYFMSNLYCKICREIHERPFIFC